MQYRDEVALSAKCRRRIQIKEFVASELKIYKKTIKKTIKIIKF